MVKVLTGSSDARMTDHAVRVLLVDLAEEATQPDFLALHCSAAHDLTKVQKAFSRSSSTQLHGGTSCLGVMTEHGVATADGAGIGFFAIWDSDGDYGTGLSQIGSDPRAAGRNAAWQALDQAGRLGEAPDVLWLTAAPGQEEEILAGIQDVIGSSAPIIGGSAADNDISGNWKVFDASEIVPDGVVLSALFPSRPVSFAYHNGYAPTEKSGVITRGSGRRINEIDGLPAFDIYRGWANGRFPQGNEKEPVTILSESTFSPLGRKVANVSNVPFYLLAHPATAYPDGSMDLFADIEEGEELRFMKGSVEGLTSRAGRVASLAATHGNIADEDIAGALVVYCAGCMMTVEDQMDDVVSGLQSALFGAPFLGVFTFGEQGSVMDGENRHGNLMISCITFAA